VTEDQGPAPEPMEGLDYSLWQGPYFSTTFVTMVACLRCEDYTTGKRASPRDAMTSYRAHWSAIHRRWEG